MIPSFWVVLKKLDTTVEARFDVVNKELHLCGPGNISVQLPPGSETFKLEQSPSGHLILPVSNFAAARSSASQRDPLQPVPREMHLPVLTPASDDTQALSSSVGTGSGPLPIEFKD